MQQKKTTPQHQRRNNNHESPAKSQTGSPKNNKQARHLVPAPSKHSPTGDTQDQILMGKILYPYGLKGALHCHYYGESIDDLKRYRLLRTHHNQQPKKDPSANPQNTLKVTSYQAHHSCNTASSTSKQQQKPTPASNKHNKQWLGKSLTHVIITVEGCNNRKQAQELSGSHFHITRDQMNNQQAVPQPSTQESTLSSEEFYLIDLINLTVETTSGELFGTVHNVYQIAGQDILELLTTEDQIELVQFTHENFPTVDLKNRKITLNPVTYR